MASAAALAVAAPAVAAAGDLGSLPASSLPDLAASAHAVAGAEAAEAALGPGEALVESPPPTKRRRVERWARRPAEVALEEMVNKHTALKTYLLAERDLQQLDVTYLEDPHHPGRPTQLFRAADVDAAAMAKKDRRRQDLTQRRERERVARLEQLEHFGLEPARVPERLRGDVFGNFCDVLDSRRPNRRFNDLRSDYRGAVRLARLPQRWQKAFVLPFLRGSRARKRWPDERRVLARAFQAALQRRDANRAFFEHAVFLHHVLPCLPLRDVVSLVRAYPEERCTAAIRGLENGSPLNGLLHRTKRLLGSPLDARRFEQLVGLVDAHGEPISMGFPPVDAGRPYDGPFCPRTPAMVRMVRHPFNPHCGILACARIAAAALGSQPADRERELQSALGDAPTPAPEVTNAFVQGIELTTADEVAARSRLSRWCATAPGAVYGGHAVELLNDAYMQCGSWRGAIAVAKDVIQSEIAEEADRARAWEARAVEARRREEEERQARVAAEAGEAARQAQQQIAALAARQAAEDAVNAMHV